MQYLDLRGPVGFEQDNHPEEVSRAATALVALGRLGAIDAARSGEHDGAFDREIRSYQEENDLEPDGVLLPGGPTQTNLNRALAEKPIGPSLLEPASTASENAGDRTLTIDFGSRRSALEDRFKRKLWPVHRVGSSDTDELPQLSDRTRRAMDVAARIQRKARAALDLPDGLASSSAADLEQIMIKDGFRYVPDPMGRVGEGDWVNSDGRRVDASEAARIARDTVQEGSPHLPFAKDQQPSHRERADWHSATGSISQTRRDFAVTLDAASHRVASGDRALTLILPITRSIADASDLDREVQRINGALREVAVENALRFRATSSRELAKVLTVAADDAAIGPPSGRSRIREMLITAANTATEAMHASTRRAYLPYTTWQKTKPINQD